MSQRLAAYNGAGYNTRSCRQQCFYGNGIVATENVLAAAVSGDGHEVAQHFTFDRQHNARLHSYKILQQQIVGRTNQSVEDIEKWLRYTSEHISNPDLNAKNTLQDGLYEQLSEVSDKELLTDIELTARKLNIDYDAILAELQNNKIPPVNEKDDFVFPDLRLDDLIITQEIVSLLPQSSDSNTDVSLKNVTDEGQQNVGNDVGKAVENAEPAERLESLKQNQKSQFDKTEVLNNRVKIDSLDTALTMSIQDLSIENDSSDGSSDSSCCTNVQNEPNFNKSEKFNVSAVAQKKSTRYNTRKNSTNSSSVKSKCQPGIVKRRRQVNNRENIDSTASTSTASSSDKASDESDARSTKKPPRSSASEWSGSESDDLCSRGRHPSFVTAQELVVSRALEEAGITADSLEHFYNSVNIKTWRCHLENCGRTFAKLCYLKVHLMTHLNVKPFKCDHSGCSWAFYSEFKLKRHKQTHLNKKDYVCLVAGCQRRFTTVYNLASHQKLHARPSKIACQVIDCSAKFQTKRALESHMRCHDESLAPYVCEHGACAKRFYSSNALMTHQRCHSYSEEELRCSWPGCGKAFDQPCRKKAHMRSHTGHKPYACAFEACGWAFSTSSKLKRHQKKHTNDRKFACDQDGCGKAFMHSQHLKEHKLTHSRERMANFWCHHCSAGFAAKSSLYVHVKNHVDKNYVHGLQRSAEGGEKTARSAANRKQSNSSGSSASEGTSNEEADNISVASDCMRMPVANVILQKMYKCPVEPCSKWYSHRSSLRVHLRKHASSALSEIQRDNEINLEESATTSSPLASKPNEGAARTELACQCVLRLKPDRQVVGSNEVGTVELSEGLLFNEALPSIYCQDDAGLSACQILRLDTDPADGVQVLD